MLRPLEQWPARFVGRAIERLAVLEMLSDAHCHIAGETLRPGSATVFEKAWLKPPSPADPTAFVALRLLPGEKPGAGRIRDEYSTLVARMNMENALTGLCLYELTPGPLGLADSGADPDRARGEAHDLIVECVGELSESALRAQYRDAMEYWVD